MAPRHELRRWAAPFAFLLALTIAVVLVHRALSTDDNPPPAQTTVRIEPSAPKARTGPRPARRKSAAQYYVVQSGDTFGSIAARYGLTLARIEELNPGVSSNTLTVGQRIRVG